ncbi:cytochrome c biogenesis protein ResB [Synechococcus sp. PCC 7336]|uniref:cytochrome c biogenesis protein ResB n=1 Tax=Synechococcus sp. PCC 7336 TaxID=195250 RepID=UPI00036DF8EF|nr:cytochrome c biogenesis protein ResB [Synechococcus sp. PCC 7336]
MQGKVLKFLGSIQLAVPLLGAIALVLIGATFYEARVGSEIVQRQIYKSGWFGLLMFGLAINLGVSALSRFPWRGARKWGFALTHLGLIVLIAGSAAVIHLGVEGMLPLRTDLAANRLLRLQGEVFEVLLPDGSSRSIDLAVGGNGRLQRRELEGLTLVDYRDRTLAATQFVEGGSASNPALHLRLTSQRMGQAVEEWLAAMPASARQVNLGPATLELVRANSESELARLLKSPEKVRGRWGSVVLEGNGDRLELDVERSVGQTIALTDRLTVQVVNFWPDFRLNDRNEPATASEQLLNPALQLQVTGARGMERWFVFGRDDLESVRTVVSGEALDLSASYRAPSAAVSNVFRAIVGPQGNVYYSVNGSQGFQSGSLRIGAPIPLGWADFQIELTDSIQQAVLQRQVVEAGLGDAEAIPAVLVETPNGDRRWLQWGIPQAFETEDGPIYAAYSPKSMELPFAVALEDFIVDRNEGSDAVAMWTSRIRIDDPALNGHEHRTVWMNHPTWYRGWKIAQASWNPGDLRQSTLQVKREPTWVTALTWTGSLLVVTGIGVMFYGPGVAKQLRSRSNAGPPAEPNPLDERTVPESSDLPSEAIA